MKAVVFGGSGFLGSHVADVLTEKDIDVIIYDIAESKYLSGTQKMVVGDILDRDAIISAVEGADYVYNFAGIADLDEAATLPSDTVLYNVLGTCNIMDACVKNGVKRFVYASSFYANSDKGGFYRCSKQAAELYIEEYNRKYGMDYTILRYGSLYGPRADKNNGLRQLITSAHLTGSVKYRGTGDETREYIHIRDAAALSVRILDEKYKNAHIVLTGHDSYKIKDIINVIGEILDKELTVKYEQLESELHYKVTPYSYKPKNNMKLVSNYYHDIGQGIIECLNDITESG